MAAKTISIPEAGREYFGLSRNGSYAAAKRGEIPTIKIGRLFRVPVAAMNAKFEPPDHFRSPIITNDEARAMMCEG